METRNITFGYVSGDINIHVTHRNSSIQLQDHVQFLYEHIVLTFGERIIHREYPRLYIPFKNGSYPGAIGGLQRNEVDMALGNMVATYLRSLAVQYSVPYRYSSLRFLVRRRDSEVGITALFKQFSWTVWLGILLSLVVVSGIRIFIIKLLHNDEKKRSVGAISFTCLWDLLSCFLNKSVPVLTDSVSSRLVIGFWWLFVLPFVMLFSSILTSDKTSKTKDNSIDTLEHLTKTLGKNFWFCVRENTFEVSEFSPKQCLRSDCVKMYKFSRFRREELPLCLDKGQCALFYDSESTIHSNPKYHVSSEKFRNKITAVQFSKGSPLREKFNLRLEFIMQAGLIKKLEDNNSWRASRNRTATEKSLPDAINPGDLNDFILLLVHMFSACVVVIFMELFYFHRILFGFIG